MLPKRVRWSATERRLFDELRECRVAAVPAAADSPAHDPGFVSLSEKPEIEVKGRLASFSATESSSVSFLRLFMKKRASPARASTARPPTTPPAIGPALLEDLLTDDASGEPVDEEATVTVITEPLAVMTDKIGDAVVSAAPTEVVDVSNVVAPPATKVVFMYELVSPKLKIESNCVWTQH